MPRPELDRLISDLGKLPDGLRKELRPAMRKAAEPILADAKRRASWSSRIPGAITLGASFTARKPGVRLRVNAAKAPHARPYEFGSGRNRNVRFRVFGSDRWAETPARPFFFPAVRAAEADVVEASNAAVIAAARAAGFR